jgi:hypothetical protein
VNGIAVKVIAVIGRARRRRDKMMLAINKNGAARDIDDARCRFNRVELIGRRLKQLDFTRGYCALCRVYPELLAGSIIFK